MAGSAPAAIQRFVDSTNAGDTAALLDCFATDAVLSDWGRDFTGRDGIASWNLTDNIGVRSKLPPLSIVAVGYSWRVTVSVSGGFNREGTMLFTLAGDKIARLVIS